MSQQGNNTPAPGGAPPSEWDTLTQQLQGVLSAISPLLAVASIAAPGAAAGIAIGLKIAQGVLDAEPTAVALFKQISSGNPPTPEQLAQFESDYEVDYQKLKADVAAALAKAGGGA
jgi:hypothetical protein